MKNDTFNLEKTLNAVLYISEQLKRSDFHKIFKILYFSDREHLMEYGRAITGDTYIAMEYGPVPSNLYDILKSVRGGSYFKDNGKYSQYFSIEGRDIIKPNVKADLTELSKSEIRHLNNAVEKYADMSMKEITDKSHDYAWSKASVNGEINLEDIILEAGGDSQFADFVKENYCANTIEEYEYA
jgi:uncharacterized phage-associated protein